MGERVITIERPESAQETLNYDERMQAERQKVIDAYAGTPMAYTTKDGIVRRVSGSAQVMADCPPMQSDIITAEYMEQAFSAAAAFEAQLAEEEKLKEPEEESEKDKEDPAPIDPENEPVPVETVVIEKPTKVHEKTAHQAAPEVQEPVPAVVAQEVTQPTMSRPESVQEQAAEVNDQASAAEVQVAPAGQSSATAHEQAHSSASVETTETNAVEKAVAMAESKAIEIDTVGDIERSSGVDGKREPIVAEPIELPEPTREEQVALAVQAVIDVIDDQQEVEAKELEVIELLDTTQNGEQIVVEPVSVEVVTETVPIDTEVDDVEEFMPAFELPTLPELSDEHDEDEATPVVAVAEYDETDDVELADANETKEGPGADDVVEHVLALTAILQAEGKETENADEIEFTDDTSEQPDQEHEQAAEVIVTEIETDVISIEEVLKDLGVAAPETLPVTDKAETRRQVVSVIESIETLEAAKTAEACNEAVKALRSELTMLFTLLGYKDAAFEANRMLQKWQHDLESLKRYMIALEKTIASMQSNTTKQLRSSAKPRHWQYGASAVRMVVKLVPVPVKRLQSLAA